MSHSVLFMAAVRSHNNLCDKFGKLLVGLFELHRNIRCCKVFCIKRWIFDISMSPRSGPLSHNNFQAPFNQKNTSMLCIGVNKIKINFATSQLCCGVVHYMRPSLKIHWTIFSNPILFAQTSSHWPLRLQRIAADKR